MHKDKIFKVIDKYNVLKFGAIICSFFNQLRSFSLGMEQQAYDPPDGKRTLYHTDAYNTRWLTINGIPDPILDAHHEIWLPYKTQKHNVIIEK